MAGLPIVSKAANAMSMTVQVRPVFSGPWARSLNRFRERNGGGLWVGGTLVVYEDRVQFKPNLVNRVLQTGADGFDLPWRDVGQIHWRAGVLTSIIELQHGQETEAVRCFGAKKLAEQMRALQTANQL